MRKSCDLHQVHCYCVFNICFHIPINPWFSVRTCENVCEKWWKSMIFITFCVFSLKMCSLNACVRKTHVFNFSNDFLTGPSQNKAHFKSFFHQVPTNANMFATTNMCFHACVVRIPINPWFFCEDLWKTCENDENFDVFRRFAKILSFWSQCSEGPRITPSRHFLTGFSKFLPSFWSFCQKKRLGPKNRPFCKVFGLVTAFLVFGGSKKVEIGLNRKNDMSPIKNFLAPLFFWRWYTFWSLGFWASRFFGRFLALVKIFNVVVMVYCFISMLCLLCCVWCWKRVWCREKYILSFWLCMCFHCLLSLLLLFACN